MIIVPSFHYFAIERIGYIIDAIGERIPIERDHDGNPLHLFFVNPDTLNVGRNFRKVHSREWEYVDAVFDYVGDDVGG